MSHLRLACVLLSLLCLSACGGGGGGSSVGLAGGSGSGLGIGGGTGPGVGTGGGSSSGGGAGGAPASTYAARCAVPRTGTDPITGQAYPDRQGTLRNEQDWLSAWTHDLYLWYAEVTATDPTPYGTAVAWFDVLKTAALTPSGRPKDRFHFTYTTAQWEALSRSGISAGYGIGWDIVAASPPRQVVVAYLEPNLPAGVTAPAVVRGTQVVSIDGAAVVDGSAAVLNAGLSPASVGEQHVFVVQDPGSTLQRTLLLTSASITETPVQDVQTLAGGSVGYLLFNDHLATSEAALVTAISQLKADGVSDLVLDIRYNGGGYLDIASELAWMIAGPARTTGHTFELTRFNDQHPTIDPVTLTTITPVPFLATSQGFSLAAGQALPTLGLGRVTVLTGSGTCSASEAIINSLRGVGVQVVQVGSTTCGKPYGFYPADNCGTTYFSIQFQGVNDAGFGNYPDGFVPANGHTAGIDAQAVVPGCAVGDDFGHALGDPAEARLAAALQYRSSGTCPVASGLSAAPLVHQAASGAGGPVAASADVLVMRPPTRTSRILGH